jgi:hypothetical protein
MAERVGNHNDAQQHYRRAMLEPDAYVLNSYATWLINDGRPRAAIQIVNAHFPSDNARPDMLTLCLIKAHRKLGEKARSKELALKLGQRFDAAARLGQKNAHLREQAELAMLLGHTKKALLLAKENWLVHRETADAIVLAKAAQMASDRPVQALLKRHIEQTGLSDARLIQLLP